jgi:hypothetical protein
MLVVYMQVTVQEYFQSSVVLAFVHESQIVGKPYFKARESGQTASTSAENQAQRSLVCESHAEEPVFIRLGSCHPMKGASLILPTSEIFGLDYTCRKEEERGIG